MRLFSPTPMLLSAALLGFAAIGCAGGVEEEQATNSTSSTITIDSAPSVTREKLFRSLEHAFACTGADPAVSLDATVVDRPTSKFDDGAIRLTAKVTNIGSARYTVDEQQQRTIELWGRGPGGHYFPIAQKALSALAVNESISFDVEREWSPSYEPWEAFKVVIGNLATDDCNFENNVSERTREEINALF